MEPWINGCGDECYHIAMAHRDDPKRAAEVIGYCITRYHAACALSARHAAELVLELEAEVARLKRGDFTPTEFQDLCHHRDEKPGCTRADFEAGCHEYQKRLFGEATERTAPTTAPRQS